MLNYLYLCVGPIGVKKFGFNTVFRMNFNITVI